MPEVLLLNQYYTFNAERPEFLQACLPLNLLYIGSYIRRHGIDCTIAEFGIFEPALAHIENGRHRCGKSDEEIAAVLLRESPRIVGIGCMFTRHFPDVLQLAGLVRRVLPHAVIVFGGNHASFFSTRLLAYDYIDYVVAGEGEETFLELCRAVLGGEKNVSGIKGLAYRDENGMPVESPRRDLIEDLGQLAVDYEMVEVTRYAEITRLSPFLMRYPALAVTTSRGCPNKCIYCTVKSVYGRTWRGKSPEKVVDEMELLKNRYGIREVCFLDDSASLDRKRWEGICDEIIRRGLDIKWTTPNGIAHWTLDEGILDKMKLAGCYRITLGIESGNPDTRKFLGKSYPLEQAASILKHANRIGMWTICTNILGFPYETREQMADTVRFACKCGTDFATFFLLGPHITSDVYAIYKKEGLADFDYLFAGHPIDYDEYEKMNRMLNDGGVKTTLFSSEELKRFQTAAYRKFVIYRFGSYLLNPMRLLRKIRSIEDLMYCLRLIRQGFRIFGGVFAAKTTKKLLYSSEMASE